MQDDGTVDLLRSANENATLQIPTQRGTVHEWSPLCISGEVPLAYRRYRSDPHNPPVSRRSLSIPLHALDVQSALLQ